MIKHLLLLLLPCLAMAQNVVILGWDGNTETNCVGYKVLAGTASRTYTLTNTVPGRVNNGCAITNLAGGRWYFAVVAFDSAGSDSDFSNEVSWTNRLNAPKNFKLTGTIQASITPTGPWSNLAQVDVPLPPLVDKQQFYRSKLLLEELP